MDPEQANEPFWNQDDASQTTDDQLKMTEMTMLFLHVTASPTLPINALTPCLSGEGVSLWTDIRHPPPTVTSTSKQTFLSTDLACLLAFEGQAS